MRRGVGSLRHLRLVLTAWLRGVATKLWRRPHESPGFPPDYRWFGPNWSWVVCVPDRESATPILEFCQGCTVPVSMGDRGLIFAASAEQEDTFNWFYEWAERTVVCWHIDCYERTCLGRVVLTPRRHPLEDL